MLRSRVGRAIGATVIACGLAVIFTYPVAFRLDRVGRLETGDGHWSIWCVTWVAHALATNPASLYQANIFHPHRDTLAYSENNIVAGVLGLPAYLLTENPYATHNTSMLLGFALAYLGAYALVRHLTGSTTAALVAGLAFAYCPFMFARTAHIQLMLFFGVPFAMLALHRLVEQPTIARSLVLGGVLAVQALACGYYGIFAGMMVGAGTLHYAVTRGLWRSGAYWGLVALAAAVSVGVVVPFFLPYMRVQNELGFTRSIADAAMYSADWRAWLASGAWAHRWLHPLLDQRWNEVLFPGFVTTILGVAGGVMALRAAPLPAAADRDGPPPGCARDTVALYGWTGAVAFWISFGPAAGLYTLLFHTVPVFSFLRAPGRIGIVVVLALVVLMGIGLSRWLAGRSSRTHVIVGVGLFVALGAELATMPLAFREAPPVNTAYRLLAHLPRGAVVELPFFYSRSDFPRHAWYMTNSTWHWQPLINGYSDHIPRDFRDMVIPLSSFPSRSAFRLLRARDTRYVVFTLNWYDVRLRARLMDRLQAYQEYLRPLSRENDVWLYEIVRWPD